MDEKVLEQLCLDMQRMKAVNSIQNIVSTTSYMFAIGEYSTIVNAFFSKREDVTAAIGNEPVAQGRDAVWTLMVENWDAYAAKTSRQLKGLYPDDPDVEGRNGLLDLRALASPIIEVAGDGQTAKGLWLVPGTQTFCSRQVGGPEAHWYWCKLAMDFVLENGAWKIWHFWTVPCFSAPYDKSWVEAGPGSPAAPNPYTIHDSYPHPPRPPKPYQTFADTFSYETGGTV